MPVLTDGRKKLGKTRLSFLAVGLALASHKTALLPKSQNKPIHFRVPSKIGYLEP